MILKKYLAREKLKPAAFAARIGVSASTVTRFLRRERQPSLDLMRKIAEATGGEVAELQDFLADSPVVALTDLPPQIEPTELERPQEFRVLIPQALLNKFGWKSTDTLVAVPHKDGAMVRRAPTLEELRGLFKDADTSDYRDRRDRY